MRLSALVVALSLMGCAADDVAAPVEVAPAPFDCHGSFRVEGFEPDQAASLTRSAARFNGFLGREHFKLTDDGCALMTTDLPGRYGSTYEEWGTGAAIRVDLPRLAAFGRDHGTRFETAILHEMGHSLGMQHVAGPAIMGENGDSVAEDFTDADRIECRRVGVCS